MKVFNARRGISFMVRRLLNVPEGDELKMLHDIAVALDPYKERPEASEEFVVEGTLERPEIILRYPGKKVKRRDVKNPSRKGSVLWEALYDFLVVPIADGKELQFSDFNYRKLADDFCKFKKSSEEFWDCLVQVYEKNTIPDRIPHLPGMNSRVILLTLKWMWLQEDINYKYKSTDIKSPTAYTYANNRKALGRKKSWAVFLLMKRHGYDAKEACMAAFN